MNSSIRNLREVLGLPFRFVTKDCNITEERLGLIEDGIERIPHRLLTYYANILDMRVSSLEILFSDKYDHVKGFQWFRKLALKIFNGYLEFTMWLVKIGMVK